MKEMKTELQEIVEVAIEKLGEGSRFDKLVDLRDECQRLIRELRDQEFEQMNRELAELQAKVSEKRARANNIDKVARAAEPRKPRAKKQKAGAA